MKLIKALGKRSLPSISSAILILAILFLIPMMFGINDAGHRTVVQFPTGKLFVKFSPGIYPQMFGRTEEYNDVITFDFDKNDAEVSATLDQQGIAVRYQDGGTGTIFGKARFSLPVDEDTMLKLHKDFRSNAGVAQKLLKPVTEEAMNLTAGLMTSEDAYAVKRGTYTDWAQQQIKSGKFLTELKEVIQEDEATGQKVVTNVPVIVYGNDGLPQTYSSDFKDYLKDAATDRDQT